ncbi:hypothetical protein [Thioclava sp. 'Guangxiensis']|uniref:hypothetical protein n=1 Tax=Thioclava sp. 'Guangxiensis' TaxID=3149044 RepID=UPI003877D20D
MVLIGGTVSFSGPNADFLLDIVPDFMPVQRRTAGAETISTLLSLMSQEIERGASGSMILGAQLANRASGGPISPQDQPLDNHRHGHRPMGQPHQRIPDLGCQRLMPRHQSLSLILTTSPEVGSI